MLYENIRIENASQWPIWIGPQQAVYHDQCSLLWPFVPGQHCPVPAEVTWSGITFRNVSIVGGKFSPGVILGNESNPIRDLVFDGVVVVDPAPKPWKDFYGPCVGVVGGRAQGGTWPKPTCFE